MADFEIGNMVGGNSPKFVYITFLLKLFSEYYRETAFAPADETGPMRMERALAVLCAFVPQREQRIFLWDCYLEKRAKGADVFSASVDTVGLAVEYLSDSLELDQNHTCLEL